MRMEIPQACAYFVDHERRHDPHSIAGVTALWQKFEHATTTTGELKSGDWVLEDHAELSEEFVTGTWSLIADFPTLGDYVKVEADNGMIRFYGSATAAAHHALGKLAELLTGEGWHRYDDYSAAVAANTRVRRPRRAGTAQLSPRSPHPRRSPQARRDDLQAALTAAREGFASFRNFMVVGFAVSVFTGTEVLQPAVLVAAVSSMLSAAMCFSFERALLRRRAVS